MNTNEKTIFADEEEARRTELKEEARNFILENLDNLNPFELLEELSSFYDGDFFELF